MAEQIKRKSDTSAKSNADKYERKYISVAAVTVAKTDRRYIVTIPASYYDLVDFENYNKKSLDARKTQLQMFLVEMPRNVPLHVGAVEGKAKDLLATLSGQQLQ